MAYTHKPSFRGKNWNITPITIGELPDFYEWRQSASVHRVGTRFWVSHPEIEGGESIAADYRACTPQQALRSVFYHHRSLSGA